MLFLLLLAVVVIAALGFKLLIVYMSRIVEKQVNFRFESAEEIARNQLVPAKWLAQLERRRVHTTRWRRIFGRPIEENVSESMRQLAIVELGRLETFFARSSFFENPEARELLMGRLAAARELWSAESWQKIAPPAAPVKS